MKSIRIEVESVSPHIFNQSGQSKVCRRESAAEIGRHPKQFCHSNLWPLTTTLKHLSGLDICKEAGICWLNQVL